MLCIFVSHHFVFDGNQNVLESGLGLPVFEQVQVLDSPVGLVDAGDVYFVVETDVWGFNRVLRATDYLEAVNAVIEDSLDEEAGTL